MINRSESEKWREMKRNVELLDMCMCIVFAFQLIKSQRSKIRHRSEKKWREMTWSDGLWRFACGDVFYDFPLFSDLNFLRKSMFDDDNAYFFRSKFSKKIFVWWWLCIFAGMNIFMWSDGGGGWRKTTREVKEYEDDLIFMKTKNYRKRKQSSYFWQRKLYCHALFLLFRSSINKNDWMTTIPIG